MDVKRMSDVSMHTVSQKTRATFWTRTPMFQGGFLHFLYDWKQE